jgi:conjugative relaxase-like TrwC/TraI family protein
LIATPAERQHRLRFGFRRRPRLAVHERTVRIDEKYARDDYYSEDRTVAGEWFGIAAAALGLTGTAARADFNTILRGVDPRTGVELVAKAHGREQRRAGWDATFSAPKSVSIQALIGGDPRLVAAHREAVTAALGELETYAQARRRHGQEWVTTGNLTAVRFDHLAARPSQTGSEKGYAPDPQLHTHVVIANLTRRPDGAWRSLEPLEIYRSQSWATALYRSHLAEYLVQLGYGIESTGRRGEWELVGYTRDQIMEFSNRRQDIERESERRGLSGAAAAQNVAHSTRLAKDHRDETELKLEWGERAAAIGLDFGKLGAAQRPTPNLVERLIRARTAVSYSAAHNTERDAVMDRRALETIALHQGMGAIAIRDVRRAAVERKQGELIEVTVTRHPNGAYTTAEMVALERDNIELMRAGLGKATPVAAAEETVAWAAAQSLSEEQTAALKSVLAGNDWVVGIEGRAGAAKTTTVGALRKVAAARGCRIEGFGPTTGSVRELEEAGVAARTIASLLENRSPTNMDTRTLWIVDESSLLATRQVNGLLHQARVRGVERIIFVGDQRQHHAIEAGRPMLQLQKAGMPTAWLETLRRQRDPELRKAVALAAAEKMVEAAALLGEQQRIVAIADPQERYRAIAHEYVRSHHAGNSTLVVSPANDERAALNEAIRARLKAEDLLGNRDYAVTLLVSLDLTGAQRARAASYQPGDVIRFSRGSRANGLTAGVHAAVQSTEADNNQVCVTTRDGRTVTYDPRRLKGAQIFHAESRAFSQGERVQFRLPHRELGVANGQFADIVALDSTSGDATLRLGPQWELKLNLKSFPHLEHGYAVTSYASQGATVDRVLINIDTTRSRELVNRQQFYVSLSRARHDALIFTDSRQSLPRAISRTAGKAIALDAVDSVKLRAQTPTGRVRPTAQIVTPPELIGRPGHAQRPHQEPRMRM